MKNQLILKLYKLIFLFLAFPLLAMAQNPAPSDAPVSAGNHILRLKKGVLLVRLFTSENKISALMNAGKTAQAEKVRMDQQAENQRIVKAFRKHFTFCPVYFFYSSDTKEIQNGNIQGHLLNENLERDNSITLPTDNFYIAEISNMEQNSGKEYKPENEAESAKEYTSFTALFIRDRNFVQLERPFPYFVRTFSTFDPLRRTEDQVVQKLNTRLTNYYKNVKSGRK